MSSARLDEASKTPIAVPLCRDCGLALTSDGNCASCTRDRTWDLHRPAADASPCQTASGGSGAALEVHGKSLDGALVANASSPGHGLNRAERYEVLGTLGRGAMGLVLQVRDTALDELLALKVLDPEVGLSEIAVERFKQEVRIARKIHHPNVARIHDLFEWHQHLAISQEYIAGRDLDEVMGDGPLAIDRISHYLRHICSALAAAHDIGVVHRDLKPSNIRVDHDDRPHILDFGLAVLGDPTTSDSAEWILGTPTHMAPEQIREPATVDLRADLYSLGVILFRMATGRLPFQDPSPAGIIRAHLREPPPSPRSIRRDVSAALEGVILRCLEKDRDDRYGTVNDLYEALRRALSTSQTEHHDEATARPPRILPVVLVVDDNAPVRAVLRNNLEQLSARSLEAGDGFQGVETAMRDKPCLILLDVEMPVLDGREALRILKSTAITAPIPVIMLTEVDDLEEELLFRELGAEMTLNKPVKRDILGLLLAKYAPAETSEPQLAGVR